MKTLLAWVFAKQLEAVTAEAQAKVAGEVAMLRQERDRLAELLTMRQASPRFVRAYDNDATAADYEKTDLNFT